MTYGTLNYIVSNDTNTIIGIYGKALRENAFESAAKFRAKGVGCEVFARTGERAAIGDLLPKNTAQKNPIKRKAPTAAEVTRAHARKKNPAKRMPATKPHKIILQIKIFDKWVDWGEYPDTLAGIAKAKAECHAIAKKGNYTAQVLRT